MLFGVNRFLSGHILLPLLGSGKYSYIVFYEYFSPVFSDVSEVASSTVVYERVFALSTPTIRQQ